jgi:hypothetical protein
MIERSETIYRLREPIRLRIGGMSAPRFARC